MQPQYIAIIFFSSIALLFGNLLNAFISTVCIKSWAKGKPHSPVDLILSSLGISNIVTQSFQYLGDVTYFIINDVFISYRFYFFYAIFCGASLCSCWVTAWLCIFYSIRIITFQHRLVTYLKMRFHTLLPRLLSGSIVLSITLMALLLVPAIRYDLFVNTANNTCNQNEERLAALRSLGILLYGMSGGVLIPLLLTLSSLSMAITSLILHVLRHYRASTTIGFSQLKVHVNAALTMTLLLVLRAFHFIALLTLNLNAPNFISSWFWICTMIYYFSCTLQALTLILRNRKLNLACWVFSCPNQRKNEINK